MQSKIYPFLFASLFFPALAGAQTWFPDDKAWVYNWGWWGNGGYNELAVKPPQLTINGMTCKDLSSHLHYAHYDFANNTTQIVDEDGGTIRLCQAGDSIFSVDNSGQMTLQYDFSLEPGDSLMFYNDNIPLYKLEVESVGTETVQGQTLRTQQLKAHLLAGAGTANYDGMGFNIIETIGMVESTGGWNDVSFLVPSSIFNAGADYPIWALRCALGPDYEYKLLDDCYELILDTDEQDAANAAVSVYPNPAQSSLVIQNKSGFVLHEARVYSMSGSLLFTADQLDRPIQINELPKGAYLLVITGGQGVFRRKFVKA